MSMLRRLAAASVCLVASASALTGCARLNSEGSSSSGDAGSKIKLGATNVTSGAIAATCKPITDGATAWFRQVDATGGVNGRKVDFEVKDDQYDPSRAAANARKLADSGVIAFVGGCGTANEQAAQTVAKQRKIPQIGPMSNLPDALDPAQDAFFALFPTYGDQDAAALTFALGKYGVGRVVHVSQNIPGIKAEDAVAGASVKKAGGTWLGSVYTDPTTTDYTPMALKVRNMHPDYILFSGGSAQTAQIVSAFKAQNVVPAKRFVATTSSTDQTLLKAVDGALDGRFVGLSSVALVGDATKSCLEAMHKYAPGMDTGLHGLYGCSVAQSVTAALKKIHGPVNAGAVAKALNEVTKDEAAPAFGPVTFTRSDHSGVRVGTAYGVEHGTFVPVGTAEFSQR